ncbi:MAG TPA: hypothetical protein PLN30_00390 [Ferruginibacter sp.]|nr:hypothetical protein [Ferruginibacter sp.]
MNDLNYCSLTALLDEMECIRKKIENYYLLSALYDNADAYAATSIADWYKRAANALAVQLNELELICEAIQLNYNLKNNNHAQ